MTAVHAMGRAGAVMRFMMAGTAFFGMLIWGYSILRSTLFVRGAAMQGTGYAWRKYNHRHEDDHDCFD